MHKIAQQPQATSNNLKLVEPPPLFCDPDPPPLRQTFPAGVTRRVRAHLATLYADLDLGEWDDTVTADLLELVDAFMVERSQPSILLRCQTLQSLAGRL